MKYTYLLLFTCICISCISTKQIVSINSTHYKIKQIENNDFAYIIYAQKKDSIFKIISLKDSADSVFEMIQVGNKYQLNLKLIYPNNLVEKSVSMAGLGAKDSSFISLERKTHYSLYIAQNLNGLGISVHPNDINNTIDKFSIFSIFCDACKNRKKRILLRLYVK